MAEDMRARMIQQTRREILLGLNLVYPVPFSFHSLCSSLLHLELPDEEVVKKDLAYLIDKGHVEQTNRGDFVPWAKRLYKLTAQGNEVANRITHDKALDL